MGKARMALVLVTALAVALPAALVCAALLWNVQTVNSRNVLPLSTSIALDANGRPRISYTAMLGEFDEEWYVRYAAWNGTSWDLELVDSPAGSSHSLQLDADGHPHISYGDFHGGLKYAAWNGTSWEVQTVSGDGDTACLDLDSDGHPHISYYGGNADPKYAAWNGTSWDLQTVEERRRRRRLERPGSGFGRSGPHCLPWRDQRRAEVRQVERQCLGASGRGFRGREHGLVPLPSPRSAGLPKDQLRPGRWPRPLVRA